MEQFFQNPFLGVLNMSITGSYVILFVIAARLLLKKAPINDAVNASLPAPVPYASVNPLQQY